MKKTVLIVACAALAACSGGKYGRGVPREYDALLDDALSRAGNHAEVLRGALRDTPAGERGGMAYLIAYMPDGDLQTIDPEMLAKNVHYAYMARAEFAWTKALPDSVFLNEVLPYANVDETRESWRPMFYDMFAPEVKDAKDIREAVEAVNRDFNLAVGVEYNTAREKTNQSPSESMRQHMASCTGLSILLVDAFRAVGIPARFAGTANWHDDRGNHSWVEVWIDGRWYFTEFYPDGLDRSWFLRDAGRATPGDRGHAIYAVSYKPTGDWFPMTWSPRSRAVNGTDVTRRYIDVYESVLKELAEKGSHVPVRFRMYKSRGQSGPADRVAANVDVFRDGAQIAGGRTSGPQRDLNDVLTYDLEKNGTYLFRYADAAGNTAEVMAEIGDTPADVTAYME